MFEIDDVKLGKAKVVSITEARQSMATIMTDNDFSYIITKNNEPVRVIVNYDTLRRFQVIDDEASQGHALPQESSTSQNLITNKPAKQSRSLKGLLKEREEELKKQAESKNNQPEAIKKAVNDTGDSFSERQAELEATIAKLTKPKLVIPKDEKIVEEDIIEDNTPKQTEDSLIAIAQDESPDDLIQQESEIDDLIDQPGDYDYDDTEVASEESQNDTADLSQNTLNESADSMEYNDDESLPPESRDYFRRFEKLYAQESAHQEGAFKYSPDSSLIEEGLGVQTKVEIKPETIEEPIGAKNNEDTDLAVDVPVVNRKKNNDFPSIEDLLKELEDTKLTDED